MPQFPFKWPPVVQIAVVLCIVAFMVAVLYPVYRPSPQRLRQSGCQSNMKQIALAMIQYEQDADEKFTPGVNPAGNGWAGQLYTFIKSKYVYRCPADGQDDPFISYAENRNISGLPFGKLAKPAATVAAYEFTTLNCDPSTPETVSATGTSAPQDSARHDPSAFGLNFLMIDGHVKWLLPAQVSGGVDAVSPKALPQGKVVETFAVK